MTMEVQRLKVRGSHSLAFTLAPVLARTHGFEAGDLFEVTVNGQAVTYRKLSKAEAEVVDRVGNGKGVR